MKKIILITRPISPPWDEASKNFAYYLAKNINDFELGLLTYGILPDLSSNIHQKAIYTSPKFTYLQKLRLIKHLRKIKNDYDILHYLFTPTKQNSFLIKHFMSYRKSENTKTIQTIATLREDLYSDKEIKKLMFGDLIITYSDYAKDKLNKLGFNNVKRVYPGIDLEIYHPTTAKDPAMLHFLNLTEDDFVIMYPGEYARLGATDDLVNLIIRHAEEFRKRKIILRFTGRIKDNADLKKKSEIEKMLKEKNALDIVRLKNDAENTDVRKADFIQRLYNISDAVIFPVRNMKGKFDIPLAVIEAMACEKPVIISDLPILSELAKDNNSVIIPKGDIEALFRAILDLYENPMKRESIGQNARKFVEENFDIKKIAEIYRQIYEKL